MNERKSTLSEHADQIVRRKQIDLLLIDLFKNSGDMRDFIIDARILLSLTSKSGIENFCTYAESVLIPQIINKRPKLKLGLERDTQALPLLKQGIINTLRTLFNQKSFNSDLVVKAHRQILQVLSTSGSRDATCVLIRKEQDKLFSLANHPALKLFTNRPQERQKFDNHYSDLEKYSNNLTREPSLNKDHKTAIMFFILILIILHEIQTISSRAALVGFLLGIIPVLGATSTISYLHDRAKLAPSKNSPTDKITDLYNNFFNITGITPIKLSCSSDQERINSPGLNIVLAPIHIAREEAKNTKQLTSINNAASARRRMVIDKSAIPFWSPPEEKKSLSLLQKIRNALSLHYSSEEINHIKILPFQNRFILLDYRDNALQQQITTLDSQYQGAITKFIEKNESNNFKLVNEKLSNGNSILLKGKISGTGGKGEIRLCSTEKDTISIAGIGEVEVYSFTAVLETHSRTQYTKPPSSTPHSNFNKI